MFWIGLLLIVGWRTAPVDYIDTGLVSGYRPWQKSETVPYARYPGRWRVRPPRATWFARTGHSHSEHYSRSPQSAGEDLDCVWC